MKKKNKKSNKKNTKLITVIALGVITTLAFIYFVGLLFFSSHFLFNTTINGINVSLKNVAKANELLKESKPVIKVIELDKEGNRVQEIFKLKMLDNSFEYDTSDVLHNQNKINWLKSIFVKNDLECAKVTGSYDESRIDSLIANLYCAKQHNIIYPENAHYELDNGKVVVKNANDGNYIQKEVLRTAIIDKINELINGTDTNVLDLDEKYEKALVREDDPNFEKNIGDVEKMITKNITIETGNEKTSISNEDIYNLLCIDTYNVNVDDEKINNFISLFVKEHRNLSIDKAAFKKDLSDALLKKEDASVKITKSSGDKGLVEVIIKDQMLYYYENKVLLLSSPIVTGNKDITEETPHGRFVVTRKNQNSTLMGEDYVEHVDYWIGFDETGRVFGFHDASWRSEYGGDIYLTNPSRGCVNMPLEKVSVLFDYVELGTDVYVHD